MSLLTVNSADSVGPFINLLPKQKMEYYVIFYDLIKIVSSKQNLFCWKMKYKRYDILDIYIIGI